MVLADHRRDVAAEVDVGEDLGAGAGVLADEEELGLVQLAGLAQDLGRHDDLAEVVQQRGGAQQRDPLAVPAELGGDRAGELGHPALMAGGVGVAQLGRRAQRGDRRPAGCARAAPSCGRARSRSACGRSCRGSRSAAASRSSSVTMPRELTSTGNAEPSLRRCSVSKRTPPAAAASSCSLEHRSRMSGAAEWGLSSSRAPRACSRRPPRRPRWPRRCGRRVARTNSMMSRASANSSR